MSRRLRLMVAALGATWLATACARMTPAIAWQSAGQWADFNPPGFPPGARISILSGDPTQAGPFVVRIALPDGYAIPPHWHPTIENVTVLQGTVLFAMGERADRSQTRPFRTGAFAAIPARQPHYAWMEGATILQVHGEGPFQLHLVNR